MRECTICRKDDDCKSLDLYVIGSEGTQVCTSCELAIIDFIRAMRSVAVWARKEGYRDCKAIRASEESES